MREILFRGKRINNREWVEGNLVKTKYNSYIVPLYDEFTFSPSFISVLPETIGQFTGLTDKKRVKIFEGDIFKLGVEKEVFEVRFEHGCFMAFCNGKQYGLIGELQMCFINIIGNIHDNSFDLS